MEVFLPNVCVREAVCLNIVPGITALELRFCLLHVQERSCVNIGLWSVSLELDFVCCVTSCVNIALWSATLELYFICYVCRREAIRVYGAGLREAVHRVLLALQAPRGPHPLQAIHLLVLREDVPPDLHPGHAQAHGPRGRGGVHGRE